MSLMYPPQGTPLPQPAPLPLFVINMLQARGWVRAQYNMPNVPELWQHWSAPGFWEWHEAVAIERARDFNTGQECMFP